MFPHFKYQLPSCSVQQTVNNQDHSSQGIPNSKTCPGLYCIHSCAQQRGAAVTLPTGQMEIGSKNRTCNRSGCQSYPWCQQPYRKCACVRGSLLGYTCCTSTASLCSQRPQSPLIYGEWMEDKANYIQTKRSGKELKCVLCAFISSNEWRTETLCL